jgi:PIN domain nuclease of toxin-antitoxin system
MKYLLDTHSFIWAVQETQNLGKAAQEIMIDWENDIYVSTVSFWEISLKVSIHKFAFAGLDITYFPKYAKDMGFAIHDMLEEEAITFCGLPLKENHKDPFDRMLIWQAITYGFILISKDTKFDQYKENGLKMIW